MYCPPKFTFRRLYGYYDIQKERRLSNKENREFIKDRNYGKSSDIFQKAPLIPRVSSKSRSRVKYVPTKETLADWNETRYEHYKSEMQRFHKELASLTARHIQAVTRLEERIARRQAKLESEILDQLEEARGKRMVRYCYCKDTFKNKMKVGRMPLCLCVSLSQCLLSELFQISVVLFREVSSRLQRLLLSTAL